MNGKVVVTTRGKVRYPNRTTLFFPSRNYPEYLFHDDIASENNEVYDLFRNAMFLLDLDAQNYSTKSWNPLGEIINPGQVVLIKPNMVMDINPVEDNLECLVTNPALIKAVIDYTLIALKGTGKIIIGDAPLQSCNFSNLVKKVGYDKLLKYYEGKGYHNISLIDFRDYKSTYYGSVLKEVESKHTGRIVNLDRYSAFSNMNQTEINKLRITNYPSKSLTKYHSHDRHSYCIAPEILEADVIINMPKPKTHRKAGVTGALKNLVGINADKTCLPHHTMGAAEDNGDEYYKHNIFKTLVAKMWDLRNDTNNLWLKRFYDYTALILSGLSRIEGGDKFTEGSWYGNDTIWRTILDLNKIMCYADKNGVMQEKIQRKILVVADMIIAGEKEGPLMPSPKYGGSIIVGTNPVSVDKVICAKMGFDWKKIPSIVQAQQLFGDACEIKTSIDTDIIMLGQLKELSIRKDGKFLASNGWKDIL